MSWRGLYWQYSTYQCLFSFASVQTSDKVCLNLPCRLRSAAFLCELRTDSNEIKVVLLEASTLSSNKVPPTYWLQSLGPHTAPQGRKMEILGVVSPSVVNQC